TQVDLWPIGPGAAIGPPPSPGAVTSVRLARMVPMTWLDLLARDPAVASVLSFELNPTLMTGQRVLRGHFALHEAFAWRDESLQPLAANVCDPQLLNRLRALGPTFTFDALMAELARPQRPSAIDEQLHRLLDAQVVRPVAPFARAAANPARSLAQTVAGLDTPRARHLAESMHRVADAVDACETASATARLSLLGEVRTQSLHICASLDGRSPAWSSRRSLVYENTRWAGYRSELPPAVGAELEAVVRAVRARMVRSTLATFVCRHFLECFGPEGETHDIIGFLTSFIERDDFTELVARALTEDRRALARLPAGDGLREGEGAGGHGPAAATVFFQLAARDSESLRRGDFTLVVNQIGSGYGGLVGRFIDVLEASGAGLRDRLRAWLLALRPDTVLLEAPMVNDWSNLHPVVGVGDHLLRWPGEVAVSEGGAHERRLDELALRASSATDELYFVDRQGRRVAPVYMGVTPSERISGARGLFLLLLDPWVSDHTMGRRLRRFVSSERGDERTEHVPRDEQGRIVFRRAQWRVPLACLPRQAANEGDFAFLVRLERWRHAEGLPEEAFAECEEPDASLPASSKPTWVHFHSPHTYSVLMAAIGPSTTAVYFTEVLPRRDQHWCSSGAGAPPAQEGEGARGRLPADRRVAEFLALGRVSEPRDTRRARPAASYRPRSSDREWLYFKIYPGSIALLDDTVRTVVGPVIDQVAGDMARWFFLRYIDAQGPHIRLRVRPRRAHTSGADDLRHIITQRLENLTQGPVRRLLIPTRTPPSPTGWRGVTASPYRPEYLKYGGAAAMDVVEAWFERSSTIARQLLAEPFDAVTAAAFMHSAAPVDEERFWEHYLWHWTGQYEAGAAGARDFLLRAARDRRLLFADRLALAMVQPAVHRWLDDFRTATSDVISRLRDLTSIAHAAAVRFDLVHMHNNRLGIVAIEEAYLAGLLLGR
ncbi:MAG: lantibiotic dehydratase C-terminal domain-containing protein, partial [Vicinamibacterales bacterium]